MAMNQDASPAARAICGLATPPGRAAVATILFRGALDVIDAEPALFRATNGRCLREQSLNRIVFGHWGEAPPEDVVTCRTAADVLEIHCHGGEQAAGRILSDLDRRGTLRLSAEEFARVLAPGVQASLQVTLQRAATARTADFLLAQLNGVFEHELRQLRSLTERAVSKTSSPQGLAELTRRLDHLLRWSEFGRHLTHPWHVVLAGRANVGKSSLINALLGFSRSIVFDEPGTTRDVVTGDTAVNGWPVCLSDTAGLRTGGDSLEAAGMARTREQLACADCRLIVIDASEALQPEDREILQAWPDALVVANKCDLPPHSEWAERVPDVIRVSALTGMGLDRLLERIADTLVPEVPSLDQPLPVCELHVAAIRRARAALEADDAQFEACLTALDELLAGNAT